MDKSVDQMTVSELKDTLSNLGLSTKGRKAALVQRLNEANKIDKDYEILALKAELARKESELALHVKTSGGLADSKTPQGPLGKSNLPQTVPYLPPQPSTMQPAVHPALFARLPVVEPTVFLGDPLQYGRWANAFDRMVGSGPVPDEDKLYYLEKYVGGKAKESIENLFMLGSAQAYTQARGILLKRFGHSNGITDAFRTKLHAWPKVPPNDGMALRSFADFLQQCLAAQTMDPQNLAILDDRHENRHFVQKLPSWAVNRWGRIIVGRERSGGYPTFADFADFVSEEADVACEPSVMALQDTTSTTKVQTTPPTKTVHRATAERKHPPCAKCSSEEHRTRECSELLPTSPRASPRVCQGGQSVF